MANPTKTPVSRPNGSSKREDFDALLAAETKLTAELADLERQAEQARERRNAAVFAWLEKYGKADTDKYGRRVLRHKDNVTVDGQTFAVVMAYQGKEQSAKPNGYVRRISAGESL